MWENAKSMQKNKIIIAKSNLQTEALNRKILTDLLTLEILVTLRPSRFYCSYYTVMIYTVKDAVFLSNLLIIIFLQMKFGNSHQKSYVLRVQ